MNDVNLADGRRYAPAPAETHGADNLPEPSVQRTASAPGESNSSVVLYVGIAIAIVVLIVVLRMLFF